MRKRLFPLLVSLLITVGIKAQNSDQEIDLISSILKSEIKVFFAQNMTLSTHEAEKFWTLYDAYEESLKPLSNQRINMMKAVISADKDISEEALDKKIIELSKIQKARQNLRLKYYKRIKKELGIPIASQFYQIDGYIYTNIAASLSQSMPIIVPGK
ncbi:MULTISPECIES: hypothetical protein [unclassified Carboxylicivirga]|uniref:hypothetical protein n=1 Tax=Carboxylicivirga TaxID=1628153 RepID=UPI003D325F2C